MLSQTGTLKGSGHGEHLPHAGPSFGPLVADYQDIARLDFVRLDGLEAVFFTIKHASGTAMEFSFLSRDFHDAPFWSQVSPQDHQPSTFLEGLSDGSNDPLSFFGTAPLGFFTNGTAGDGRFFSVEFSGVQKMSGHQRHSAGAVHVGSGEAPGRFEIGQHRGLAGDPVKVIQGKPHAGFLGQGDEMKDGVG